MPYVPSEKTDGKSQDRNLIDVKVEALAKDISDNSETNFDLPANYLKAFSVIGRSLFALHFDREVVARTAASNLALTIFDVAKKYEYDGAFLGELNYAITRLIQIVPRYIVKKTGAPDKNELRYWLYAVTVEALTQASVDLRQLGVGIGGVFEDIKDEYKRRVNVSYEAAQIIKSGDCYDAPYYTRLVEIVDDSGKHVGYQEVMLKRSEDTLKKDVLDEVFVLQRKTAEVTH